MTDYIGLLIGLSLMSFILNLPAGYLRGRSRKYSLKWFFYVHLPVPFIVLARIFSHIEIRFIPLLVIFSVMGQMIGSRLKFQV